MNSLLGRALATSLVVALLVLTARPASATSAPADPPPASQSGSPVSSSPSPPPPRSPSPPPPRSPSPPPPRSPPPPPALEAQPSTHARVNLEYDAPALLACPDRDAFASALATRLGYEPALRERAADAKTLSVVYAKDGRAVVVHLRLSSAANEVEAEKKLVSETGACNELGAAAAFAAAVLLDPRAMFPHPTASSSTSNPPGASLDSNAPGTWPWYEPRGPLPAPAPPPEPPPAPWMWRLAASGEACLGCSPALSAGGKLAAGVSRGALGVDIGVKAMLPTSASSALGKTVRASLIAGEIFPHARLGPARLGLLASVGSLLGESDGDRQASLWAATGARAALDWNLAKPVFVRFAVEAAFLLSRVSLRAVGVELWSTPAVVAGASVGVGLEF